MHEVILYHFTMLMDVFAELDEENGHDRGHVSVHDVFRNALELVHFCLDSRTTGPPFPRMNISAEAHCRSG
jgi:hypothetical protein